VIVYETPRLVVREWTDDPADLARIFDTYSRWEVARWLGSTPRVLDDPAQAAELVARWKERSAPSGGRYGIWAVQPRERDTPAGSVLLVPIPDGAGEIEVGWHLHPDAWGNGYATEAARGALAREFEAGGEVVYAVTHVTNSPSQAVCRRLGMAPLGRTDRWYGMELEAFRIGADAFRDGQEA
jgi:RimJ/RimL family protein N-acetyltransferase